MKRWIIIVILAGASLFFYLNFFNTNAQLYTVEAALNSTHTQLESTKTELKAVMVKIASTETELQSIKGRLQSAETELASTSASLSTIQVEMDEKETELVELQISYEGLMTGHGYTLTDPTYSALMRFLENDDTDKAEYIKGEYECAEFATNLCNRAEDKDIRCAYVSLRFPDGRGHAIVAFDTIDKGLTYIEPQYDDLVEIEIGKPFYQCVVPSGDYTYEKSDQDDTIEKVLVAW